MTTTMTLRERHAEREQEWATQELARANPAMMACMGRVADESNNRAASRIEESGKDSDGRLYSVWVVQGTTAIMMAESIPTNRSSKIFHAVEDDLGKKVSGILSTSTSIAGTKWKHTTWQKVYGGYDFTEGRHLWIGQDEMVKLNRIGSLGKVIG